jgi:hypothetical protein
VQSFSWNPPEPPAGDAINEFHTIGRQGSQRLVCCLAAGGSRRYRARTPDRSGHRGPRIGHILAAPRTAFGQPQRPPGSGSLSAPDSRPPHPHPLPLATPPALQDTRRALGGRAGLHRSVRRRPDGRAGPTKSLVTVLLHGHFDLAVNRDITRDARCATGTAWLRRQGGERASAGASTSCIQGLSASACRAGCVVIGPRSIEQLQGLLAALDVRLDEDLLRDIDESYPRPR